MNKAAHDYKQKLKKKNEKYRIALAKIAAKKKLSELNKLMGKK